MRFFGSTSCLLCFEDNLPIGIVFLSLMSDYKPNKKPACCVILNMKGHAAMKHPAA